MTAEAAPFLAPWSNFYVIVGSTAGALTGLQFVVIALVADAEALGSNQEIRAFGTPTVVHFCVALLISAIANAPWHLLSSVAIAFGTCGATGVVYAGSIIWYARAQTHYFPDAEDWCWYAILPLVTYATLLGAAKALPWHPAVTLFVVGATSLALLFIGIHNAWDTVTYVALTHVPQFKRSKIAENPATERRGSGPVSIGLQSRIDLTTRPVAAFMRTQTAPQTTKLISSIKESGFKVLAGKALLWIPFIRFRF